MPLDNSTTFAASVVICVRNGASKIQRQLDALAAQQDAPRFQVVVVNHKSTDNTADVVRTWATSGNLGAITKVTLVHAAERDGIPYARNIGCRYSQADLIMFCDADDQVDPSWVRAFVEAEAPAAGGMTDVEGGQAKEFSGGLTQTRYLPHLATCNAAFQRSALFSIGGFDESLLHYGFEDVDVSWRLQEAGYDLIYVPQARVNFSLSPSTSATKKGFLLGFNRVLIAHRYPMYDPANYSPLACAQRSWSHLFSITKGLLRREGIDRSQARRAVASLGSLTGSLYYTLRGYPDRSLPLSK